MWDHTVDLPHRGRPLVGAHFRNLGPSGYHPEHRSRLRDVWGRRRPHSGPRVSGPLGLKTTCSCPLLLPDVGWCLLPVCLSHGWANSHLEGVGEVTLRVGVEKVFVKVSVWGLLRKGPKIRKELSRFNCGF